MTEKLVEKGLEILNSTLTLAQNETPKLLTELINYLIFTEVMQVLTKLVVYIIAFNLIRMLTLNLKECKKLFEEAKAELEKFKSKGMRKYKNYTNHIEMLMDDLKTKRADYACIRNIRKIFLTAITAAFVMWNFSSITIIGKLLIAPKIFLIKEGASLLMNKQACNLAKLNDKEINKCVQYYFET